MLDRADCADFGCHNSMRLETKHFLNTLALTFISFSGRFVFAMQKHYLFFCKRSSSLVIMSTPLGGGHIIFLLFPPSGVPLGFRSFQGKVFILSFPNLVWVFIGLIACMGFLLVEIAL